MPLCILRKLPSALGPKFNASMSAAGLRTHLVDRVEGDGALTLSKFVSLFLMANWFAVMQSTG